MCRHVVHLVQREGGDVLPEGEAASEELPHEDAAAPHVCLTVVLLHIDQGSGLRVKPEPSIYMAPAQGSSSP